MSGERVTPDGLEVTFGHYRLPVEWYRTETILRLLDEEIAKWDDVRDEATTLGHEQQAREAASIWRAFVRFRRRFKEADDE